MKYKRESRTWRSSADLDTESDANDAEPLLSDASVTSRRSFGAICMFPDASETSDFEYSRQVPTTSGKGSGATSVRSPYFLQTMSNIQKDSSAMADCITRFQYYSKIKNFIKRDDSRTVIPEHVVPSSVFVPYIPGSDQQPGKQSSIVTIFAVWNTIMGSSLLTMPWGIERAGLVTGIVFMLIMGAICLYTSYLLLRVQQLHGGGNVDWEVADLAGFLLGRKYEMVAKFFSLVVLLGANIVYWILMSNFLYHSVDYIYERVLRGDIMSMNFINNSTVICPKNMTIPSLQPTNNSVVLKKAAYEGDTIDLYDQIWNIHTTVPIFLTLILGPLVNFKSATFFTKFNSLGTLSVMYLLSFVLIKAVSWGIHVDFFDKSSPIYVPKISMTYPALTGMLALALFIHNIIVTIMRNNKHQEKNNLLDNFQNSDVMTVIARIFLFFQLVTVYPLIAYMLRVQVFTTLMKKIYPGFQHVLLLNTFIITTCVLFAIFLPRIGTIIRFTGALSGFIYIFSLPSMLHIVSLKKRGQLSLKSTILHTSITFFGFANLMAQFFISEQ
ncbi:UNVERIFIED_CONTAM: hypothetical protein PYX00_004982 [Menopon gallinae]|uniref:Amino acid transporter transmembrane domain-containing protein n=1 Tax=Menopon gallinae TaxID=328185 RepID=A0AAW2I8T4_9NEOP